MLGGLCVILELSPLPPSLLLATALFDMRVRVRSGSTRVPLLLDLPLALMTRRFRYSDSGVAGA